MEIGKMVYFVQEECDFLGKNEVTMEVHLGKLHSEKFECGCLENLEIH